MDPLWTSFRRRLPGSGNIDVGHGARVWLWRWVVTEDRGICRGEGVKRKGGSSGNEGGSDCHGEDVGGKKRELEN